MNAAEFRIRADLDAYEGDIRVYAKSRDERVERLFDYPKGSRNHLLS